MRSRIFITLSLFGSFAIPYAAYAGIPFFGPIVPGAYNVCPAGWGMVILVINNLISFLITIAIVFVAPLMIAYAGFLFVVNPVHAEGIGKAKSILLNTIVGIVLALAGYLIVDALMAVLYNGKFGSWAQIITWDGEKCLPQRGALPGDGLNQGVVTPGITTAGAVTRGYYEKYPSLLGKDQTGSNWTQEERDQLYTGSQAMSILDQADIEVNRGYSPVGQDCGTQCTSLNGIPKTVITTLVDAKTNCATCAITVTGGTEGGHQSQGFGKASIDLRYDENTYMYLTNRGTQVVREAPLGNAVCATNGWKCYSHVTKLHMSVYTSGGTVQ